MISVRPILAAAALGLVTSGCSFYPNIVIFNGTGQELVVHVDDRSLEGWNDRIVMLAQGAHKRLTYSAVIHPDDTLRLSNGRCEYAYRLPRQPPRKGNETVEDSLRIQVGADFMIYLRPVGNDAGATADLIVAQQDGDPVRPSSRTCG